MSLNEFLLFRRGTMARLSQRKTWPQNSTVEQMPERLAFARRFTRPRNGVSSIQSARARIQVQLDPFPPSTWASKCSAFKRGSRSCASEIRIVASALEHGHASLTYANSCRLENSS